MRVLHVSWKLLSRADVRCEYESAHLRVYPCSSVAVKRGYRSMRAVTARLCMQSCATIHGVTPRSDVVGSLLRPDYLRQAQGQLERGELTPAQYKRVEDRAVDDAVALQQEAGLDVVTDGEMRRYAFFGHL